MSTETRYPDAPKSEHGSTIATGDWFEDFGRDQMELAWGISPKTYKSATYQLLRGEGRFCEFKHDPHTKYNHLSIEIQERAQDGGPWVISGPFRCQQPYYAQGDKHAIWVFPTHMLITYALSVGIWINWEDEPRTHLSHVIDEHKLISQPFPTLRRFFLKYEDAVGFGGVKIITMTDDETSDK